MLVVAVMLETSFCRKSSVSSVSASSPM